MNTHSFSTALITCGFDDLRIFWDQQVGFPGRSKTFDRAGLFALGTARGLACTGSFAKTTAKARYGKAAAEFC